MSAAPLAVPIAELPPEKGFLRLPRGIDEAFDWRKLPRRMSPWGFVLMCYIVDKTLSAYGSPPSARIEADEFRKLTGLTERSIRRELAKLENTGLLSRGATDPWRFTPHPEARAPLLMPTRRPVQTERRAAVTGPSQPAAFRSTIAAGQPKPSPDIHLRQDDGAESDRLVRLNANVPLSEKGHSPLIVLEQPADRSDRPADRSVRPAATYCPWNWPCPFLSSELPADKPLKPYKPKDENSAVRQSVASCAPVAPTDRPTPASSVGIIHPEPPAPPPVPSVEIIPAGLIDPDPAHDTSTTATRQRPAEPPPPPCRWCGTTHEVADLVAVVQRVALPVIGSQPTVAQYHEIHRCLDGACTLQFDAALEAKKRNGKLNSVAVLPYVAGDCARSKHAWKPPTATARAGKKSFADGVLDDCAEEIRKYGRVL